MAITIDTETNVAITPGVSVLVAAASASRKSLTVQLQAEGTVWFKLGGTASPDDGIRASGWQNLTINAQFATQQPPDFYEGEIHAYWEGGGVDPATNEPLTTANVRVIEAS